MVTALGKGEKYKDDSDTSDDDDDDDNGGGSFGPSAPLSPGSPGIPQSPETPPRSSSSSGKSSRGHSRRRGTTMRVAGYAEDTEIELCRQRVQRWLKELRQVRG